MDAAPANTVTPAALVVELVPIDNVHEHPRNPRKGSVEAIRESLRNHEQYLPIAVQRSTALVEAGLRPVPIKPGGKHPPMASWQHAQPTADTVRNWWNGLYRGHGVGLVMGPQPSGVYLMALDIDTHNPAADGWDALHDLEARHGDLPDTWRSITGSGGAHILFASPDAVPVRNQQAGGNRIAPGIDVRGDGGQIVVAPTLHPVTGRPYAWEFAPWDAELATCPRWLLDLVRERPNGAVCPCCGSTNTRRQG